jgi:archaellum biogenesis ATPase FlaH
MVKKMQNINKKTYQKYLAMGWSVIPWKLIDEGNGKVKKMPAIPTWREYQERLPTEDEITQWSDKYNAIAVVTGEISNLTVVDIDTGDENNIPFESLDSSIVASSPFSGGKHYYYEYTPTSRTTAKLKDSPVDIRSDGGVIILPPSSLGKNKYVFDRLGPTFSLGRVPNDVIEAIEDRKKELSIPVGDDFPEASKGDRNETLTRIVGSLFARIDYSLGEEVIWPAVKYWNHVKCDPPLDEYSLRRTYESIRDIHARNHPELILTPEEFSKPKSLNFVANERMMEYALEDEAPSTGYRGLDHYIKGFLPGHVYTITGETNVGKTAICCNFSMNVAKQGKRVLYFALEPGNTIVDYLASIKHRGTFEETRKKIFNLSDGIDVFTSGIKTIDKLKNIIKTLDRYDLVIIDHISYFISTGEGYIQEQSNAMKEIATMAKLNNLAVLMVAHINKKSSKKGALDFNSISGSSAFKQDSTEVLIVTRQEDEGKIIVAKTKAGPSGECSIKFNPGSAYIAESGDMSWG